MKTLLRITAACALAAATTALAQEPAAAPAPSTEPQTATVAPATEPQAAAVTPPATVVPTQEQGPRYGFGISTGLVSGSSGRLDTAGLGISGAILRGRLRIEPELTFYLSRADLGGSTFKQHSLTAGSGVLYELARADESAVYAGGRFGLSAAKSVGYFTSGFSDWMFAETLSAVLGGEYFPAPLVSIGLEVGAGVRASQYRGDAGQEALVASTSGRLLLRFYVP